MIEAYLDEREESMCTLNKDEGLGIRVCRATTRAGEIEMYTEGVEK